MLVFMAMAVGLVIWRLVDVQVMSSATYSEWGAPQRQAQVELVAERGAILDRDLNSLALSDDRPTVWPSSVSVLAFESEVAPDLLPFAFGPNFSTQPRFRRLTRTYMSTG